jgi:hypothetical protein
MKCESLLGASADLVLRWPAVASPFAFSISELEEPRRCPLAGEAPASASDK